MDQTQHRPATTPNCVITTQLGVGVVSRLTVEAAIELANDLNIGLMLIASRRQVDMDSLGGGYVEHWNARRLVEFVRQRDRKGLIRVCRDHGGPWQNAEEVSNRYSLSQAMDCARASFAEDIEAGFDLLHIDTSIEADGVAQEADAMERLFVLWQDCADLARRAGRDIAYEVGAEEQDWTGHPLADVHAQLDAITDFAKRAGLDLPTYVVVQTGTKVLEMRNVGNFGSVRPATGPHDLDPFISSLVQAVHGYGIQLKQHNTDYLGDDVLQQLPRYAINAANVAPEFGVAETLAFLTVVEAKGLPRIRESFLELAYDSRKWEKWMVPGSTASDRDRSIICGHYVFSTPEFRALAADVDRNLKRTGQTLDDILKASIKQAILRYIKAFGLNGQP